jgi:hypothetical protein
MKKVSLLLAFFTLLTLTTIASNSKVVNKVITEKKFKGDVKSSVNFNAVAYVWGFDGNCMQLYRIEESSYIDNNGMSQPSISITEMNQGNSVGLTTRICPPLGNSYC